MAQASARRWERRLPERTPAVRPCTTWKPCPRVAQHRDCKFTVHSSLKMDRVSYIRGVSDHHLPFKANIRINENFNSMTLNSPHLRPWPQPCPGACEPTPTKLRGSVGGASGVNEVNAFSVCTLHFRPRTMSRKAGTLQRDPALRQSCRHIAA